MQKYRRVSSEVGQGQRHRESRIVRSVGHLPDMSVVWTGQCRAAGGGGAGASSVDRHCRDGSGVWVRLWSQASEPAELRVSDCSQ